MDLNVEEHNVVCTLTCAFRGVTRYEANVDVRMINFSEPSIAHREAITNFVTMYSVNSNTVSGFAQSDPEVHVRRFRTQYDGAHVSDEVCSGFDVNGGRLFCNLASSTTNIAFFRTLFPPGPITGSSRFVPARAGSNRNRTMKICLVDPRIEVLFPPTIGHITYPSPVRHTVVNEVHNSRLAPGILFTYVTILGNGIDKEDHVIVGTSWGSNLQVPRQLVANLEVMFPDGEHPYHIKELIYHLDSRLTVDRHEFDATYVQVLRGKTVGVLVEILVAGIDILPNELLEPIYEIIGSKIDVFGLQTLEESAVRLGFIIN